MSEQNTTVLEQRVIDVMHFLTAPDQTYRDASALIHLTTATPRLRQARERWVEHWQDHEQRQREKELRR
jgi:hypothetical protein